MMLEYKAIEIFTSEGARCRNKPVANAVMEYVKELKIAARCIITRGIAGCYESGEFATGRLEVLSYNLPLRIYIVLPAAEVERVVADLDDMISDGILALHDLAVISHRTRSTFFPRQLKVCDVMTLSPQSVSTQSPLDDAVRLLLSSIFTGLPVVDESNRPVGIITQGDLIQKGGLPLRLGLLAESGQNHLETVLKAMAARKASEVMTTPVITIADDRLLTEAVDLMLARKIKRLPVVDATGKLVGMLSRLDIFRTVMHASPNWKSFQAQQIKVDHLNKVGDILRRDTHTVSPETPLDEVLRVIDQNDIQRVAVVDAEGKLLGLISDRDLLQFFKQKQNEFWGFLSTIKQAFKPDSGEIDSAECLAETTAEAVMTTGLITVKEEMLIEEAIGLMTTKALKRLPVVDEKGRFKGMISRDSLLRTGFSGTNIKDQNAEER